ncbi:MAG TPA: hypothetical protein VIU61_18110 [Kofleriaceae bacterium]
MTAKELRQLLAGIPDPPVLPAAPPELIEDSARYLASDAARRSLEADTYWPKWNSPWWNMLLLCELEEQHRIPQRAIDQMISGLNALKLQIFPIAEADRPPGTDPHRDSSCHCALGCMHKVLTACGIDVARALPWIEPWFVRYQMTDGGANCDESAYLADECASSMVATIAPFEAMLAVPATAFLDRAASFLIERRLMDGSSSRHNAEEREATASWLEPCFPRFYFYDVLRGLSALVRWAVKLDRSLPIDAIAGVTAHLASSFPDGVVRLQRRAFEGRMTLAVVEGVWTRGQPASRFPLLEAVSEVGRPCPILTSSWAEARTGLLQLVDAGRIVT